MKQSISSNKQPARLAGLLYLLLAITAAFSMMYVSSKTVVNTDSLKTATNIIANELLFRMGIVSNLISQVLFIFLTMLLYRIFKQVNENQAKLMVALVLVQIPVVFVIEAFNIAALKILKGSLLQTFELAQKQDVALLLIKIHDYGITTLEIFYGLWLIPFGLLVYKSGFMPRILGILLIVGGVCYVIESCIAMLFPAYLSVVNQFTMWTYSTAEISMVFWLLIMGVKEKS